MVELRKDFDTSENMILIHTGSEQAVYHTKLANRAVHMISFSSEYASQLMICEKEYDLGLKIFKKILPMQDKREDSPTYGVWPYYLEEPIDEMDAPDFNMAAFNAKEMIAVLKCVDAHIDDETKKQMIEAIYCACKCIMKRNMTVSYTNIALMDVLVTAVGGELCKEPEFVNYAKWKIKRFVKYTEGHGSVSEYNSPAYSIVAVRDLSNLIRFAEDEEILDYANQANEILWKMLAEHFDYSNLQLSGPHSRAYSDFANWSFIKAISDACRIDFTNHEKFHIYFSDEDEKRIKGKDYTCPICPEKYIPYFEGKEKTVSVGEVVTDGYNHPHFGYAQAATLYKCDKFSIGVNNRCDMWNQRRPFLGYIHSKEKDSCFRVKCYHDGYDFSSAIIHCVQDKGRVLGNINFSLNMGDTHISLDRVKDGLLSANDLRVIFEFSKEGSKINHMISENGIIFNVNGVPVKINTYAKYFGDYEVEELIEEDESFVRYCIVLYSGERKIINLSELEKAIIGFTVEIDFKESQETLTYKENGGALHTDWMSDGVKLTLITPERVTAIEHNMSFDRQLINGSELINLLY